MPNISRLINQLAREMRRRKVFRVVAIYAVAAWVILQLAEIVFEPMGYPDWALRGLIISAIVGFPVAFILAWVIDIKPEGLIFDLPLFSSNEDAPRQRRTSDLIFASLLIAILAGGSYYLVDLLVEDTSQVERTEAVDVAQEGNSIAVLAFENFDGDSETDYFGAGLADEILHVLAGIPELNVSSRTSSFQFRGKRMDIRDVAERLGVKNVLEGSARQQGNKIRVGAKLVDGSNGFNKWVKQYERSLDDIFSIQQEIAESVVDELKIVLSIDSIKRLDRQVTSSTDAYVEYLQGVGRLRSSLDADVMREASQYFQHSVTIDPEFARAYAGICEVHLRLYEISKGVADFELAETACEKSSALDPGLNSEIHLALGKLYGYRGWFDRAEEQLNKAISLIPDSADAHIELSRIRVGQGQSESAERLLLKAQSMKSRYWATHEALASFYYRNDQYDDAVREYEKAIKLAPEVATSHAGMGAAFWMMGKHEKAIEAYQASLDIKPSRQALTNIGSLHYYAARFDQAVEFQLKALEYAPDDHRVWGRLAESYFFVPNEDRAQQAYARAAELAAKNLIVNEKDWRSTGLLATYLAHLGQADIALVTAEKAIDLSNQNAEAYYLKAQVHERLQQTDEAVAALRASVDIDKSYLKLIDGDPFFQNIKAQLSSKAAGRNKDN